MVREEHVQAKSEYTVTRIALDDEVDMADALDT